MREAAKSFVQLFSHSQWIFKQFRLFFMSVRLMAPSPVHLKTICDFYAYTLHCRSILLLLWCNYVCRLPKESCSEKKNGNVQSGNLPIHCPRYNVPYEDVKKISCYFIADRNWRENFYHYNIMAYIFNKLTEVRSEWVPMNDIEEKHKHFGIIKLLIKLKLLTNAHQVFPIKVSHHHHRPFKFFACH